MNSKRISMNYRKYIRALASLVLILGSACTAWQRDPHANPEDPGAQYFVHRVAFQGETLGLIAGWYTGSAANWQEILKSNPGVDVRKLKQGDTINIPRALVVKETALPKSLLKSAGTGEVAAQKATAPPSAPLVEMPMVQPQAETLEAVDMPAQAEAAPQTVDQEQETKEFLESVRKQREENKQNGTGGANKTRDEFLKEMLDESYDD
jgi:hypothetical protein